MPKRPILAILICAFAAAAAVSAPVPASAHELWLERDGSAVRVYLGDVTGERDTGEKIAKLAETSELFAADRSRPAPLTARDDHLAATVEAAGDLRLHNDRVWAPWKDKEGNYRAAVMQAKAGRSETAAVFALELVPVAAGSDSFTLLFRGSAVPATGVAVAMPDGQEKKIETDAAGRIAVPVGDRGRYVLIARFVEPVDVEMAGQKVSKLHHVATVSFVAE